jgi:tetratricopeptide (TPR) repeat protein
MRVATTRRPRKTLSGLALALIGGALVAFSIARIVATGGGGSNSPAAGAAADPYAATSATIAFWETRVHSDPADFTAYNHLAEGYVQRGRETGDVGDYTRAQAAVDGSLASIPGENYTAYALKAYLQNVRHDFTGSMATALHSERLNSADPYAQSVVGDDQVALGQYDAAFQTYSALVQQSADLTTFSRMALIYEIRGDLPNAEGAWKNALASDAGGNPEGTAWAHTQYGAFLFNRDRLDEADTQYAEALKGYPTYIHALAGQASLAAARGDYSRSIDLYTQVTQRQPLPQYVAALGDVYAVAGKQTQADRQYALIGAIEQLYQANGVNVDLQMSLFYADHDTSISSAAQQALAVRQAQPASIYTADAVAWALYKAGQFDQALTYANAALAMGTQDASLFYHAGMIQKALSNSSAARDDLQKAIAINSHFSPLQAPIAQRALSELGG